MKTLVYAGGATLTFGSGPSRRTIVAGNPFEVDDDLARILLADPHVRPATGADVPRGMPERPSGPITVADLPAGATKGGGGRPAALEHYRALKARAKELGLPATGKADELAAAIAAASAPQGGNDTPADDPGADVPGEAGTPPQAQPWDAPASDMPSGAITLGDLPPGAVKGRN